MENRSEASARAGTMPSLERWTRTWRELGAERVPTSQYQELADRYGEGERHYHTARHLDECLARFDEYRVFAEHPAEVELALWFHDALYYPRRQDNEARSADWARASALAAGVGADVAARIHALVMTTRHDAVAVGRDATLLVDIDLSILGAPAERFDEYERQVRAEYAWVPEFLFRRKRRAILQAFLTRAAIFGTPAVHAALEMQARANLTRSIQHLSGQSPA